MIDAAARGKLSSGETVRLGQECPGLVTLALLAARKRIAEREEQKTGRRPSPSTPPGMIPVYTKPNKAKLGKKPRARNGNRGMRRRSPARVDRRVTQRLDRCPCCGGELQRCKATRKRCIEDIPEWTEPEVTEHTIHGG